MADVKGTLRFDTTVDDLAAAKESTVFTGPITTIRGVKWCIKLRSTIGRNGPPLCVALAASDDRLSRVKCDFSARIVKGSYTDDIWQHYSFTFGKDSSCSLYVLMALPEAWRATGVGHEQFTVDIDVEPGVPELLPRPQPCIVRNVLSFDRLMFTDMVIAVEGEEETVACNKEVVARHSDVIFLAMTTESTKEYQSGRFIIGHPCATLVNVRLMVKGMYEDLEESELKEHSADLLRLAHMYESERVSEMAVDALKRNFTADTFWRTIEVAVELDNKALIDVCAKFAKFPADKFLELVRRADGRAMLEDKEKQTVVNGLVLAMAK